MEWVPSSTFSSAEVVTGFFCEHAFEMARSEKDSLIQVRPSLLTRIGVYGMWDRSLFAAAVVQACHMHICTSREFQHVTDKQQTRSTTCRAK